MLPEAFPEAIFYFQAADMVTQILNFGIPAQIDVRTVGYDRANNLAIARELREKIAAIPGIADAHIQQEVDAPEFFATIDRARAAQFGLDRQQHRHQPQCQPGLLGAGVVPISGPIRQPGHLTFWRCRRRSIAISSIDDLKNTPVGTFAASNGNPVPGLLENVATLQRDSIPTNANHANIQPVYEVYANVEGADLGSVATEIDKIVAAERQKLKPGNKIEVLGQIDSMNGAFQDMALGLLFAAVFVYLLMVVNYQNFGDPFVVILALPATFCGILTMLYITGTTLNVPSLMGAIMAIGVASANSILLVTFAREQQQAGMSAFEAAIMAGRTPHPPGADDRRRDDRRHAADGDRRRRRRTERRAGARRHWWPVVCNPDHAADRAVSICAAAQG